MSQEDDCGRPLISRPGPWCGCRLCVQWGKVPGEPPTVYPPPPPPTSATDRSAVAAGLFDAFTDEDL